MTVRVVFDVSALLGYSDFDTGLAVGELIREIREGEPTDQVGIPASAFLTAYISMDESGRTLLANIAADVELARMRQDPFQSVFSLLPVTRENVTDIGNLEVQWPGRGQAISEALHHDAILATFEPCHDASPRLDIVDLSASWTGDGDWEITEPDD